MPVFDTQRKERTGCTNANTAQKSKRKPDHLTVRRNVQVEDQALAKAQRSPIAREFLKKSSKIRMKKDCQEPSQPQAPKSNTAGAAEGEVAEVENPAGRSANPSRAAKDRQPTQAPVPLCKSDARAAKVHAQPFCLLREPVMA